MATTKKADTKIVIVSGQEFSVPSDTETETIRQQLVSMGFADVASATPQKGKKTVDEVEYETIEFVKKAGTKGLDGRAFAALLAQVPKLPVTPDGQLTTDEARLLGRLATEYMTYGEALNSPLADVLGAIACFPEDEEYADDDDEDEGCGGYQRLSEGVKLCTLIDRLPAVAVPSAPAW